MDGAAGVVRMADADDLFLGKFSPARLDFVPALGADHGSGPKTDLQPLD
jgi:hypothetical protein